MSPEEEMVMLRQMLEQYGQSGASEPSPLDTRRAGNVEAGSYQLSGADPYTTGSAQDARTHAYIQQMIERDAALRARRSGGGPL